MAAAPSDLGTVQKALVAAIREASMLEQDIDKLDEREKELLSRDKRLTVQVCSAYRMQRHCYRLSPFVDVILMRFSS